jgi:hypothetical protein
MSYSITTEDGITIDNIPDNVDPNSPELKARVASLRATGVEKPTKKEESIVEKISQGAASVAQQLPRQLGLTARAGITGAAGLPIMAGDALNQLINMFGANLPMASKSMQTLLTSAGLPEPAR